MHKEVWEFIKTIPSLTITRCRQHFKKKADMAFAIGQEINEKQKERRKRAETSQISLKERFIKYLIKKIDLNFERDKVLTFANKDATVYRDNMPDDTIMVLVREDYCYGGRYRNKYKAYYSINIYGKNLKFLTRLANDYSDGIFKTDDAIYLFGSYACDKFCIFQNGDKKYLIPYNRRDDRQWILNQTILGQLSDADKMIKNHISKTRKRRK